MSFVSFEPAIVRRLKTGSIKNVLVFGNGTEQKTAPYVVVKPIASGDRELLQFIVHGALGTHTMLKAYIFAELPELLKDPIEESGLRVTARSTGGWTGPYTDAGDNTLAMSRDFYIPVII